MTRVAAPELAGGGSGAPAEGGGGAPVQGGARREARGGAARGDRATQAAIGRLDQGPSLRARALPRQGQRAQGRRRGTYVSGTSNFVTTVLPCSDVGGSPKYMYFCSCIIPGHCLL